MEGTPPMFSYEDETGVKLIIIIKHIIIIVYSVSFERSVQRLLALSFERKWNSNVKQTKKCVSTDYTHLTAEWLRLDFYVKQRKKNDNLKLRSFI